VPPVVPKARARQLYDPDGPRPRSVQPLEGITVKISLAAQTQEWAPPEVLSPQSESKVNRHNTPANSRSPIQAPRTDG
jgi:hypothetical protein